MRFNSTTSPGPFFDVSQCSSPTPYNRKQWRSKVPKSGGAHRHVIYVPSVKNQYKRVVFGYMVI